MSKYYRAFHLICLSVAKKLKENPKQASITFSTSDHLSEQDLNQLHKELVLIFNLSQLTWNINYSGIEQSLQILAKRN